MARNQLPIAGAFVGPLHQFPTRVLAGGKSLDPLQRTGDVGHTGFPSVGVPHLAGLGNGVPPAAPPNLIMPHSLNVSINAALSQTRVS